VTAAKEAGAERQSALRTRGLSKSYPTGHLFWRGQRPALSDLDLEVEQGEVFGYLGPNGSGKTTTMKLLMGMLRPDRGEVFVLGRPLADPAWRFRVGYLPEHPYLYDYLTAEEYLDYAGRLFGIAPAARRRRASELLSKVGLAQSARTPLRRFSKGMVQRVGLAQALINDPEFVILDEPMSGLDPIGRRLVRDIVIELKEAGKTVLFSTHILSDAETLCDRVAVLKGGKLLDVGPLARILDLDVSHMEVLVTGVKPGDLAGAGIRGSRILGERLRIEIDEAALGRVVDEVEKRKGRILSVQPMRQSLEDYFFREMAAADEAPPRGEP
jgi:ABC-2 type transport system ATP-binding protein